MPFPSALLASCDIWNRKIRLALETPRYKTKDLNERRRKQDIPGTQLVPKRQDDRIPLLLIQRSVTSPNATLQHGAGSSTAVHGWTLIVPRGWGMASLNAFSQAGIRVGGLRDRGNQAVESGAAFFPKDYPTTSTWKERIEIEAEEERQTWERKPPAKRANWEVLGTRSPWQPDWDVVLGIQKVNVNLMPADRDEPDEGPDLEETIWQFHGSKALNALEAMGGSSTPEAVLLDWVNNLRVQRGLERLALRPLALLNTALITVWITLTARGTAEPHGHIYYLPDAEVWEWVNLQRTESLESEVDPQLAELSKRTPSQALIIGYVSSGGYSLNRGYGFAVGHVSLARMLDVYRQTKRLNLPRHYQHLVKVRNRDSDMCRSASLSPI